MTTLLIFLVVLFVVGPFFNALRGGQFGQWKRILKLAGVEFDSNWKPLKPLTWWQKIVSRLFDSDLLNAVAFALFIYFVPPMIVPDLPHDAARAFFAGLAMFAGASIGWGDYIGALGGWLQNTVARPLAEWPPIDKLIEKYRNDPKKWGFYGLTLRGLLWGFLIALVLHSVLPIVAGATMGLFYWLGLKWGGMTSGWSKAEIVFGGPFWTLCLWGAL